MAFNNYPDVFEMGTSNSIDNKIVTLTDTLFIIREKNGYKILKSPLAYHDLETNVISGDEGVMETFKYESDNNSPSEKFSHKKFVFQLSKEKNNWKAEKVKGKVKLKQ